MRSEAVQRSLRRGDRIWAALDVAHQAAYEAPFLASDSADLVLPDSWSINASGGYGFYLGVGTEGPQPFRVDLAFAGLWQQSGSVRPAQRYTLNATLTHRLSDQASALAGIIWANKPEFLGEDVRAVRGTLGFRYKLPKPGV